MVNKYVDLRSQRLKRRGPSAGTYIEIWKLGHNASFGRVIAHWSKKEYCNDSDQKIECEYVFPKQTMMLLWRISLICGKTGAGQKPVQNLSGYKQRHKQSTENDCLCDN